MVLAAIIDRLIYGDSKTFRVEDAADLLRIAQLPRSRGLLDFRLFAARGSGRSQGFAAGVGNVEVKDDKAPIEIDSKAARTLRVGQWKVRDVSPVNRRIRHIEIEQMMAAGDPEDELSARVVYRDGVPLVMELSSPWIFRLFNVALGLERYVPWKRPV